jgi:ribosomal protein S18 acetylase RimI-like enzyme
MSVVIRPLETGDRNAVHDILSRAGNFTDAEIDVAMELVDEWLAEEEASGYLTYVLADEEKPHPVRGYVCFGPAPMTEGTFDLYWIAVDPDDQGHGLGGRLLAAAEEEIQSRGGRLLLIETASQDSYAPTIRFYEGSGYTIVSRVRDYYRPGDDKLIFAKRFAR